MRIAGSLTELVGNTPLVRLPRMCAGSAAEVLVKLESFNPSSSVKDRAALAMIEDAEQRGLLGEGSVVMEPTSGNMGIALAFVCASRGYRLILTMPDTTGPERRALLTALGAELVLTEGSRGMRGAIEKAEELAETTNRSFIPRQFNNPANPEAHKSTAEEIWRDTKGKVDFIVAGVGTGGTLTGLAETLKQKSPAVRCIAVEPRDSAVLSGGKPQKHGITGIGPGFVPGVLRRDLIDSVMTVGYEEARDTARRLAREEGLLAGISTGANVWASIALAADKTNAGKIIVTVACDTGERYLGMGLFG
jgi:cysteine synthase